MKVAFAQVNSGADVAQNAQCVSDYAHDAGHQGADLIVFPEAMMSAFGTDLHSAAQTHAHEWVEKMHSIVASAGIPLIIGEFEASDSERVRNVLAIYLPGGSRQTYAKVHLYDAFGYKESDAVEPGEAPLILDIAGTTVGCAVCYDIRFPNLFTFNAKNGAAVSVVSASWGAGPGKAEQWELLARARALDSTSFVVAVDQADPKATGVDVSPEAPTGVGHSLVVDPFGRVVEQVGAGAELRVVELDLALVDQARGAIPVLANAKTLE